MMFSSKFVIDAAERVALTYIEAFVGLLIADGLSPFDVDALTAAAVAAVPAALAMLKVVLASKVGQPDSASLVV